MAKHPPDEWRICPAVSPEKEDHFFTSYGVVQLYVHDDNDGDELHDYKYDIYQITGGFDAVDVSLALHLLALTEDTRTIEPRLLGGHAGTVYKEEETGETGIAMHLSGVSFRLVTRNTKTAHSLKQILSEVHFSWDNFA